MARATYTMTECKSAINRVNGMGFAWSLNPYRGCTHACAYCYARATHVHLGMNVGKDFESKIQVKTNMVEVLRRELARPGWKHEEIALGTATDPYQPIEGKLRITQGIITALADYSTPVNIVTKSPLVIRDIEELCRLEERAGVRVSMTITTLDEDVWRVMEPGTAPPKQRIRALKMLADAGIHCGVYIAPVMPRITDSEQSLRILIQAAKEAGASYIWAGPLRLAPDVREHYMETIAQSFPQLLDRYELNFARADAPMIYRNHLKEKINRIRAEFGFDSDEARPLPYRGPEKPAQMLLPLLSA